MKMFFGIFFSTILFFILLLAFWGWPWSINEKVVSAEIVNVEPQEMFDVEDEPSVIKVLTWNISYLFGEGSEGPGYESRDKAFFEGRLLKLVNEIKGWQPDVICFQEIDFDSGRSHGMNQAQYVARKAGYPYVAEAVSWEANYIPFPYWPIKNQFGRMKSGGAILSRFPLSDHKVWLLSKPQAHPWWYNVFYLHRYHQEVKLQLGSKSFKLINLHHEAFDKKDRELQVRGLIERAKESKVDIIAGDFNMVPDSATKKSKFQNSDDYENDPSFGLMRDSGYSEVIPEEIYALAEQRYFTYPATKPDRRLDYIFYKSELKMMKAEVLPSALSDHLPIRATFQVGSPKINPYSL